MLSDSFVHDKRCTLLVGANGILFMRTLTSPRKQSSKHLTEAFERNEYYGIVRGGASMPVPVPVMIYDYDCRHQTQMQEVEV